MDVNKIKIKCPYCGTLMVLRETQKYKYKDGKNRKFWSCPRFPDCIGSIGAHPNGVPLGKPAKIEVKKLRMELHEIFDQLWKIGRMSRESAYHWLSKRMRKPIHIAELDEEQCVKALKICKIKLHSFKER